MGGGGSGEETWFQTVTSEISERVLASKGSRASEMVVSSKGARA